MSVFDPAEYFYDPDIMAAQRQLESATVQEDPSFSNFFTGGFDLSTDDGRQAWATSGIAGLFLSQFYPDEDQKRWFIQRNSIDTGLSTLKRIIQAYEEIKDVRQLSKEEEEALQTAIERKQTIEDDLAYVYENENGDLDAPIDVEEQSFTDRWGLEVNEEEAYSEFIDLALDNPTAMLGGLTAELIKDAPLLGVAKVLGMTNKNLSVSQIIARTNAKLNQIQPKALRGLAKVSAGVGIGAGFGAGYEAGFSALEQGQVKTPETITGAKFGATFGVLGGLALMTKGPKPPKEPIDKSSIKENFTKENIVNAFDKADEEDINKAAKEVEILPQIQNKVIDDTNSKVAIEVLPDGENAIQTRINNNLLRQEHNQVKKELNQSIRKNKDFRGVPFERITPRVVSNIRNFEAFRMMRIAEEKAKYDIVSTARRNGQTEPVGEDLEVQSRIAAFNELNRLDTERTQRTPTPIQESYFEADRILKARKAGVKAEEEEIGPAPTTPVQDFLNKNKKVGLAVGAATGYLASGEEDKIAGVTVGLSAVAFGPSIYKAVSPSNLKRQALKAKLSIAKNVEKFSDDAKILETQMQFVLDEVDKLFPSKEDGLNLIQAIETGNFKNLTKSQREVAKQVKTVLEIIGDEAVKSGVLKDKKDAATLTLHKAVNVEDQQHLLHNYFPHIFSKDLDDTAIQRLTEFYLKNSNNIKKRTIRGTIKAIQENPKFADISGFLIDDPRRALTTYVQSMSRTIYARNLLNSMADLDISATGERLLPALLSKRAFDILKSKESKDGGLTSQQALNYTEFDHPTLKGYVAHNDIKNIVNDHFAIIRKGGVDDIKEGILKLNNGLKRVFVFGSLFHGQALVLSALYSLGPFGFFGKLGKNLPVYDKDGKVIGTKEMTLNDLKLGSNDFKYLALEAIRDGLQIINVKRTDLVNPGFADVEKLFENAGFVGRAANKVFKKLDYYTWEQAHDRFKVAAYIRKKELLMEKEGFDAEVAGRIAADHANDAFGSLNWNNFATKLLNYANKNPNKVRGVLAEKGADMLPLNKRRWLNLVLFAPDWTLSNLRIVGRMFSLAPQATKAAFLKRIHKGDDAAWNSKEGKELLAAWKLYAMYTARAGAVTSGMWWGISEMFSDKEPTAEGLWDFWFGEQSGKLDLGNGESMVISKQIGEPFHWVQHPRHTLLNKASIVPKTIVEGMFNKQWISLKKGFPMGPAISDENGNFTASWLVGKGVPIVAKPLIDPNLPFTEKLLRFAGGFFGFPQYNPPPPELDFAYDGDTVYPKDFYDSNFGYLE